MKRTKGKLLSVPQAARILKLDQRMVRRRCEQAGIGLKVSSRLRLLTRADLVRIKQAKRPVGNPNFLKPKRKRRRTP
jgi:hypothetical protein